MKPLWLARGVLIAAAVLLIEQGKSEEPAIAAPPAADPMRGKAPGDIRDDNALKLKLVWCPPGKLKMTWLADEKPFGPFEANVELTRGFWLGKFEATQFEWKQVMSTEPWKRERNAKAGDDYPATFVKWDDAMTFCRTLTRLEREAGRLPDDWEYTLPTEAQWEYACRGGTKSTSSVGTDQSKLGDYAWFRSNTENEEYAHRVGGKKPNLWGFHDMHGNVEEFCRDWYWEALRGGRDPEATQRDPSTKRPHVVRGGSWFDFANFCSSSSRESADGAGSGVGFRVALSAVEN